MDGWDDSTRRHLDRLHRTKFHLPPSALVGLLIFWGLVALLIYRHFWG
jgi:hypothetical protein